MNQGRSNVNCERQSKRSIMRVGSRVAGRAITERREMAQPDLGFVGVGRMGARMVRRLIDAGYRVTIYDPMESAMEPLVKMGAVQADSPAAVGSAAEVVFASVPTPPIVQAVALGPNGVIEGKRVKIFIDVSTTGATVAKQVAEGLAAKGITAVDAPVSGGIKGAEKGTLAVMLSCPEDKLGTVKPILEVLGKMFVVGTQPGQGQTMKLLNNLLSATAMAITSEAMVMGVKAGIDPSLIVDVFNAGTARNSATQDKIKQHVISRTFSYGFAIGLLNKDIRLCMGEADALGVPMVVGSAVRQLLSIATASEGFEADMTSIARTVEEWAGVRVGSQ
jgi:3-hydroxyisobutyrate dehydrogenase-like beta-hydroxyacid dehydrogenase